MENIGEKIFSLRKENNVSQEKLAYGINVARQTISKWETNTAQPSTENIKSLCAFFGVDITFFFDDSAITAVKEQTPPIPATVEKAQEKTDRKKTLKTVATVVGMVLLALFIVACGIAAYVTIAPPDPSGVWYDTDHSVNYVGIIILVVGIIAVSIFITLLVIHLKNKKKK